MAISLQWLSLFFGNSIICLDLTTPAGFAGFEYRYHLLPQGCLDGATATAGSYHHRPKLKLPHLILSSSKGRLQLIAQSHGGRGRHLW